MHEYSTRAAGPASPPPKFANRSATRLRAVERFAEELLHDDRLTMLPIGETLDASDRDQVLKSYLAASESNTFEQLSPAWAIPNGWQSLLGGGRANLVNGLRKRAMRNWKDGTYHQYIQLSQEELAKIAGVSKRTLQRWLEPGPELPVAISDYTKACAERDERGRKKKAGKTQVQNALLRLFITDIAHTCYRTKAGKTFNWTCRYAILPVDPLLPQQEESFFAELGLGESVDWESEGVVERPLSMSEDARGSLFHSQVFGDQRDHSGDFSTSSVRRRAFHHLMAGGKFSLSRRCSLSTKIHEAVKTMRRQNDTGLSLQVGLDATTFCHGRGLEGGVETESLSGPASRARMRVPAHIQAPARVRSRTHARTLSNTNPLERDTPTPSLCPAIPLNNNRARARTHAPALRSAPAHNAPAGTRPQARALRDAPGRPRANIDRGYDAWCAANAEKIKGYKPLVASYLEGWKELNDQAPGSTITRVARLLCGAEVPFDQVPEKLQEARESLWQMKGGQFIAKDKAGHYKRTPRFLRNLQTILGGEQNPAYIAPRL